MKRHLGFALLAAAAAFAAGCRSDDDKRYSSDGIGESDKPTEENPTVDPDSDDADEDLDDEGSEP